MLRDHRSHATGATQPRGHDGQMKQGEQEVLHARDRVGQTSGATQRCLILESARELGIRDAQAISAIFQGVLPWIVGGMITAIYATWTFLSGPSGPWVIPVAVGVFGLTVFVVGVVRKMREISTTEARMTMISETTGIPKEESGILDFGAGMEQAMIEIGLATNQVSVETQSLGRLANRQGKKFTFNLNKSFAKKRGLAIRTARAFSRRSDFFERRVDRLEKAGSALSEDFVGFVELSTDPEVLRTMHKNAGILLDSIPNAITGVEHFHSSVVDLRNRRIQRDLSLSMARLKDLLTRIIVVLKTTHSTCERVMLIVTQKLNNPSKPEPITTAGQ